MKKRLQKLTNNIAGSIELPASKSISNRVLLIRALSYSSLSINNLSNAEDTVLLEKALNSNTNKFYTGDGGTTFRFLTAFLSKIVGEWHIDCSNQMKQRPIKELVEALNELGAQISYTEKDGFPPLRILGSNLHHSKITIDGSISSQYISALLLIAPTLVNGIELTIKGKLVSKSYVEMTLGLLKEFGIHSEFEDNTIKIEPQEYKFKSFTVEADWSGASYFYELLCLANEGELFLEGLKEDSLQGDSRQVSLWNLLGIETQFQEKGVKISKKPSIINQFDADFSDMPDLTQTFAVTCCMKNISFSFSGLQTLKVKETNRIEALINELKKLGFLLEESDEGTLSWNGLKTESNIEETITINTYGDHRMAMSFAPIAMFHTINIENPEVVKKSFPNYWEELSKFYI